MKRLLVVAGALALLLGACTTPKSPRQAALDLNADYATAANLAATYTTLPRCPGPQICADQAVVDQIKRADNSAYAAVKKASDELKALPPGASTVDLVVAGARTALDTFLDVANRYGLK